MIEPLLSGRCAPVVHPSGFSCHTMRPVGLASRTPVQLGKPTTQPGRRYSQQTLATVAVRSHNLCQCNHSQIHDDRHMLIAVLRLQSLCAGVQCKFNCSHPLVPRKAWRSTLALEELDELGRIRLFCNRIDFGCRYWVPFFSVPIKRIFSTEHNNQLPIGTSWIYLVSSRYQ